jgi:hypothetical protein
VPFGKSALRRHPAKKFRLESYIRLIAAIVPKRQSKRAAGFSDLWIGQPHIWSLLGYWSGPSALSFRFDLSKMETPPTYLYKL